MEFIDLELQSKEIYIEIETLAISLSFLELDTKGNALMADIFLGNKSGRCPRPPHLVVAMGLSALI